VAVGDEVVVGDEVAVGDGVGVFVTVGELVGVTVGVTQLPPEMTVVCDAESFPGFTSPGVTTDTLFVMGLAPTQESTRTVMRIWAVCPGDRTPLKHVTLVTGFPTVEQVKPPPMAWLLR
jgi:hypothetical protein